MIEYIDPDARARRVAEEWKSQYFNRAKQEWMQIIIIGDTKNIYDQIIKLGEYPDPEDIEEIIGNDSWTKTECHICRTENCPVAVIDTDEEFFISICKTCSSDISYNLYRTFYE